MAERISRLNAVRALHAGIAAGKAGQPVTACPYNPNGTLTETFLAHWWVKGWRRASKPAETPVKG